MFVLKLCLIAIFYQNAESVDWLIRPCQSAMKPNGDTPVCVCNAFYCDEIADLPDELLAGTNNLVQIATDKAGKRFEPAISSFTKQCPKVPPSAPLPTKQNPPVRSYQEGANDNTNYTDYHVFVQINKDETYQTIKGFGGAITDSATLNLQTLDAVAYKRLISSYVGPYGNSYNIFRIPIGGSDFSVRPYTYLDCPNNDVQLKFFNLAVEDIVSKIPIIQDFQKSSAVPIKFLSSVWSAPTWMKDNEQIYGNGTILPDLYDVYVGYLIKFYTSYKCFGINFDYATIQNEPSFIQNIINGNFLTPADEIRLAKIFARALKQNNFDTKLYFGDDFAMSSSDRARAFLADPEAMKSIEGIAIHAYGENPNFPISFSEIANIINSTIPMFATEYCVGVLSKNTDVLGYWRFADVYTKLIIQFLLDGGVGWIDWNLALDIRGGPNWAENVVHSPIFVDAKKQEFYKQPTFYVMGHFSKFLPEGSVRIGVKLNTPSNGKVVAAKTPSGRIVVIASNPKDYNQVLTIMDPDKGCANVVLTPNSIQTLVYMP